MKKNTLPKLLMGHFLRRWKTETEYGTLRAGSIIFERENKCLEECRRLAAS